MPVTQIIPTIKDIDNQIGINTGALNHILETEIYDGHNVIQQVVGPYSWMKMNSRRKHIVTAISGTSFMWQPDNACTWDPIGDTGMNDIAIQPCAAKINMEWCKDSLYKSCYESVIEYSRTASDPSKLNEEGEDLISKVVRVHGRNATIGARGLLVTGGLYDFGALRTAVGEDPFHELVTDKRRKAIMMQVGTCKGWIALMQQRASENKALEGHFNLGQYKETDFNDDGEFIAEPVAFFDAQLKKSPRELRSLQYRGGLAGANGTRKLVWMVDTMLHDAVAQAYERQCLDELCKNPRLKVMETTDEAGATVMIYKVGNFHVVPVDELCEVDDHLKGHTALSVLTIGGNICLGGSFDDIPNLAMGNGGEAIGLAIEKSTKLSDAGKWFIASWGLFSTAIADRRYISGNIDFIPHK